MSDHQALAVIAVCIAALCGQVELQVFGFALVAWVVLMSADFFELVGLGHGVDV